MLVRGPLIDIAMDDKVGNELVELYDVLSVAYRAAVGNAHPEWADALNSVLYGGDYLADGTGCYGKQQNERNFMTRSDYAAARGNGDRVTDFSAIEVAEPRASDAQYFPPEAKVPVTPQSGEPLPVIVGESELDRALQLLAEFPAEPDADRTGSGASVLLDHKKVSGTGGGPVDPQETKLLFVSDTHIGYENREITDSGTKVSWIDEISTISPLKSILEYALQRGVDAVVHTGDILDHEVDVERLDEAEAILKMLDKGDVPFYFIVGTHDHTSHEPRHPISVDGVSWLRQLFQDGLITELGTQPITLSETSLSLYGIPAENVSLSEVGSYKSRGWSPADISLAQAPDGPNVLCLHDGFTPYRGAGADMRLQDLLNAVKPSIDCVLIGDEHHPKNYDFKFGYSFETPDGTPVYYTGPPARINKAYQDEDPFVSELTITPTSVSRTRLPL